MVILTYCHTYTDIAEFIKNAYEHLQALLSSETFQQSIQACYDGISEVDELFTKMLQLAQNLHHDSAEDSTPQKAGKEILATKDSA